MPSTASRIDLYNMTLDLLEEVPVTSLSDGTPAANWLNRQLSNRARWRTAQAHLELRPCPGQPCRGQHSSAVRLAAAVYAAV